MENYHQELNNPSNYDVDDNDKKEKSKNQSVWSPVEKKINIRKRNSVNCELEQFDNYNQNNIKIVKDLIENKTKCLIILRGSPGSGKSYLANQIKFNGLIASADDYFTKNGNYKYDPFRLSDAHNYCRIRVNEALKKEISPIIVDNTNSKIWEFQPYVKLALKHNYHVEILVPRTPWCTKANELANKNKHNVQLNSIKKYLNEYEKVDVPLLIEHCKKTFEIVKPKTKTGNFISNMDEILAKNDWNFISDYNEVEEPNQQTKDYIRQSTVIEDQSSLIDFNDISSNNIIEEQIKLLKHMFPNIREEIIRDLIFQYQDTNIVTNVLLDSINLEPNDNETSTVTIETKIYNEKTNVKSLKELCTACVNNLDFFFEKYYSANDETSKLNSNLKEENYSLHDTESTASTETSNISQTTQTSANDYDDEPMLNLKLQSSFLKALIQLFGNDDDEKYIDKVGDSLNIEISLKLGNELFDSWKKTFSIDEKFQNINLNDNLFENNQIETDEKISKQLFDEMNMRDPLNNIPAFMSDNGLDPAQFSLRQIMAEQEAEDIIKKRIKKNQSLPQIKYDVRNFTDHLNNNSINQIKTTNDHTFLTKDFNFQQNDWITKSQESRSLAQKYSNIKHDYLRKASEAHSRGYGSVAFYYAEEARKNNENAKKLNQVAAENIFRFYNPDPNGITIDLHGLHVKEAIIVLKKCLLEKKQSKNLTTICPIQIFQK